MKASRPVEIKGSTLPVLRVVVRNCDLQSLDDEMSSAFASARPLLAEALAVLDLRERNGDDIAASEIVGAARNAGVRLAAVLVGDGGERVELADSGLPVIQVPLINGERSARMAKEAPEVARAKQAPQGPPAPLYLTEPLRSGRRLYAQGRDLVVLAPTSRGCELIADGSIYAFGLLRGRAVAGASGDKGARIIATRLDAELVAIAGVYRTLEAADLEGLGNSAVSVTLASDDEGSERLVLRAV
ncbi:MAG TPA: septum site-determining protein MinC [Burkholderiales bacterium]|nr:septum site-determining protein MinC [Burkholderiales bacterium]